MAEHYFTARFELIKISLIVIASCLLLTQTITAQPMPGNQKKCTVCLTYDDGIDVDLDNVIPILDSLGFKGTFYIPGNSTSLLNRMEEWRGIAKNGHELGNHTLFHPCFGKSMKRDWVGADYDLDIYSMQRIVDEIKLANTLLKSIDGKVKRTFAYTCGDRIIGGEDIWDKIKGDFVAARGVNNGMPKLNKANLSNIESYMINGESGGELIELVKEAMAKNSLIVFLFHGVGGGHNINVSLQAHKELLSFLKENEKDIWVAPLVDVAEYSMKLQLGEN